MEAERYEKGINPTSYLTITDTPANHSAEQDENPLFSFEIKSDCPEAIYKCGETAKFEIKLLNAAGNVVDGANFNCEITGDWGLSKKFSLTTTAEGPCVVTASLDKPGFILCKASYNTKDSYKPYEGIAGVGFDPQLIKTQQPEPLDFDVFWNKAKQELAAVPMKVEMMHVDILDNEIECFDVKINCTNNTPVSGCLTKSTNAKPASLPGYISYHGAGVYSSQKLIAEAKQDFLALDINTHGIENGKSNSFYKELKEGDLKGYRTRNCDNPLKIYHRGLFQRVLRSLEFLKSQPEWDGRNLIVSGTSQGGAQAIVASALDSQVSFCIANVPAFCLNTGSLNGQNGFHWFVNAKNLHNINPAVLETVPYYEAVSFAKRIKCPCVFSTGFIDPYCPPSSVYAAFNNIPVIEKHIINGIYCGHDVPEEIHIKCNKAIIKHIERGN